MLAGAATGTVEFRSITESIREANPEVNYLEATATGILHKEKKVACQSVVCDGALCSVDDFFVEYDQLIVSVGASVNTFGIRGVKEHCYFLKQIADADRLRRAIGNCFERASYPTMTEEERRRTLTFVVVGAGPTGVEFAAELKDFVEQEVPVYWPDLLPYIRIYILEASDRVLMQFEASMQRKAVEDLTRSPAAAHAAEPGAGRGLQPDYVQVLLKSSVKEVTATDVLLNDGTVIPYGVAVWAAGIGPLPITLDLISQVEEQKSDPQARGRLVVDRWLRVKGTEGMLAMGDCSFVEAAPLPATAQVASQQGSYLARALSKGYDWSELVPRRGADAPAATLVDGLRGADVARPFHFLNLGILAYTGSGRALAQVEVDKAKIEQSGTVGWLAWRSVYLAKQVSVRNQLMVLFDWVKTSLFGRDLSRF